MTDIGELAELIGVGTEFRVLRQSMTGPGNPATKVVLALPERFRREALGMAGDEPGDLTAGLTRLRKLVNEAPQDEASLLQMAFNFDGSHNHHGKVRQWMSRVGTFSTEHNVPERKLRERVDVVLLLMLIRTLAAAEHHPEGPDSKRPMESGSTVARFFDQGYVHNSPEFIRAWADSTTVDMMGFGHNRMLVSYSSELQHLLSRGGRIRVLLQDPDGTAIVQANYRSSTPKAAASDARDQQRIGLATLRVLCAKNIAGTVEARLYDVMPPFTAYFFGSDGEESSLAFIWFWSWRQASSWRPGFSIRKEDDPVWFDRFYSQFSELWADDEVALPLPLGPT